MEKMNRIIMLLLAGIVCFVGCKKNEISEFTPDGEFEFQGIADDDAEYTGSDEEDTRTAIDRQTKGGKIYWLGGETVSINGISYTAKVKKDNNKIAEFSKTTPSSNAAMPPFVAYYPSTIYNSSSKAVTLPATQYFDGTNTSRVLPMYVKSTTERTLVFKNICGLLEFRLKGQGKVKNIVVTANKALSGPCTIDASGNAVISSGSAGVTLDCSAKQPALNLSTENVFYVAVPPASYTNLKVTVNKMDGTKWEVTSNGGTVKVERNKIYKLAFTEVTSISFPSSTVKIHKSATTTLSPVINNGSAAMKSLSWTSSDTEIATVDANGKVTAKTMAGPTTITVTDLLSGAKATVTVHVIPNNGVDKAFTVNASGTKVYFAPGNLYFNGKAYDFEANQYDCRTIPGKNAIINGVSSTTGTPTDNWGLFGYSNGTTNNYGRSYVLTTSTTKSVYDGAFVDWNNALVSDKGSWRSLTKDEIAYLLFSRSNKMGFAKVNGVYGIIVLPDSFTDPNTSTGKKYTAKWAPGTTACPSFQPNGVVSIQVKNVQNIYSGNGWTAMENNGAIFLPGAGYRMGSTIYDWNINGNYWTSSNFTYLIQDSVYSKCKVMGAWDLQFNKGGIENCEANRAEGQCVRLVRIN